MTEVIIKEIKKTIHVFEKKFQEAFGKKFHELFFPNSNNVTLITPITLNNYHSNIKRKLLDSLPNMIVEIIYSYIDIYKRYRRRYCVVISALFLHVYNERPRIVNYNGIIYHNDN